MLRDSFLWRAPGVHSFVPRGRNADVFTAEVTCRGRGISARSRPPLLYGSSWFRPRASRCTPPRSVARGACLALIGPSDRVVVPRGLRLVPAASDDGCIRARPLVFSDNGAYS